MRRVGSIAAHLTERSSPPRIAAAQEGYGRVGGSYDSECACAASSLVAPSRRWISYRFSSLHRWRVHHVPARWRGQLPLLGGAAAGEQRVSECAQGAVFFKWTAWDTLWVILLLFAPPRLHRKAASAVATPRPSRGAGRGGRPPRTGARRHKAKPRSRPAFQRSEASGANAALVTSRHTQESRADCSDGERRLDRALFRQLRTQGPRLPARSCFGGSVAVETPLPRN